MKVLLLGGTGAIGVPLSNELASMNHDVFVTSRRKRHNNGKIKYIAGNAMDDEFLDKVISRRYDVIIDFMIYTEEQLKKRIEKLLSSTSQYIFLSSCRVYAPSDKPVTEESPRLLDVCRDREYMQTNEYALSKAREEDIIMSQNYKNWTIIRPTLTYNSERMQLGCYELNKWMFRALNGRSIVFQKDLADVLTSMTYGNDVSKAIALLAGNPKASGEIIQIASSESRTWKEVLEIYCSELKRNGIPVNVVWQKSSDTITELFERNWQRKYSRAVNRRFDSSKFDRICGVKMEYTPVEEGIRKCIREFVSAKKSFKNVNPVAEAYMDRVAGEHTKISQINGKKNKIKYMLCRYTPYIKMRADNYSEK